MPNKSYGPVEVTSAEVIQTRNKADYPGQRRNYNYVIRFTATNTDTGELTYVNEYRTIANDRPLSNETILQRFIDLIEEG